MRNTTIWESASRPLFVRTVWLEGSELRRRGLQRQFLWDYDTSRPVQGLNSLQTQKTTEALILKRSASLELSDFTDFDDFHGNEEDTFLVGSAKVKLHQPFKLLANKKSKYLKYRRRTSIIFNQRSTGYDTGHLEGFQDISRRNSDISQIQAIKSPRMQTYKLADTAEELLAERVLHWLDLAGKEDFFKHLNDLKEMEVKLSKTSKLRQDAIKRYHNKTNKNISKTTKNRQHAASSALQVNVKPAEAVKHITIIFNKEGQPIRLNRPAKNIDLCALSNSPSTTRRLAGTLASARLYKSAENPKTVYTKARNANVGYKLKSAHRRLDTVADLTNSTLQQRLHDSSGGTGGGFNNLHDSKKQLHIFMPTLPKKGLSSSIYGTEDGLSELSHNFNGMCKI